MAHVHLLLHYSVFEKATPSLPPFPHLSFVLLEPYSPPKSAFPLKRNPTMHVIFGAKGSRKPLAEECLWNSKGWTFSKTTTPSGFSGLLYYAHEPGSTSVGIHGYHSENIGSKAGGRLSCFLPFSSLLLADEPLKPVFYSAVRRALRYPQS